jgi:hypothetical protein
LPGSHHHNANNPHISVAARFITRADSGTVPRPALRNKLRRYRGSSHHHNAYNPHISVAARFIAHADSGTVPPSGIAQ